MVSIEEVARAAEVSAATVSRALSGRGHVSAATRRRVEAVAQELGYVPSSAASSLASGRTRNVGVIVPFLDRWYFGTVLGGISEALMEHGYDITLYNVASVEATRQRIFDSFIHRRRVDGVVAVGMELDEVETATLAGLGIPVVAIGGPARGLPWIAIDDVAVARLATEHLIALGHRRIGHIGGDPLFDLDFHVPTRRRLGYEEALADAGIQPDAKLVEPGNFTIEGGYVAAKQLLGGPGRSVTAIFAGSDEMAIGAILAARDLGLRVPQDLSIIGIDGHDLGPFFGLTTVDQFPAAQGRSAARVILADLDGDATAPGQALPYELLVRSTTMAVPRTPAEPADDRGERGRQAHRA